MIFSKYLHPICLCEHTLGNFLPLSIISKIYLPAFMYKPSTNMAVNSDHQRASKYFR